jgi:serine/threonine protein kinase
MTTDGRRYRVLGVLGKGGFGTVYRAEMLGEGGFRRQVALKMLNSDMDAMPEIAQRLRDEARLLGMLRHRAILQGDGLVVLDDRWTVVMEYIDGVDLQLIGRKGVVPAGCALEIIGEVASALHVAYTQTTETGEPLKLIHRDIKPSNILLTRMGETKVLDFGIARANFAGREAKTKGMRFGSPGYMAPERLDFEEGPAGDVYALGVVLAELVGGDLFGHSSVRPDRHQSLIDAAAGRMKLRGVPDEVVAFMAELVAYEPAQRPLARDVERKSRELRGKLPAPWLRDWAEEVVPPILNLRGLGSIHDLSNSVLVERSGGQTSATISFEGPEITEPMSPARSQPTFSDEGEPPTKAPDPRPALGPIEDSVPPPRVKRLDPPTMMPTSRGDLAPPPKARLSTAPPPKSMAQPVSAPPPRGLRPETEIPPPKPKVDNHPTPPPTRSRTESRETPPAKPVAEPPAKPKTESIERSRPKTESIERQKPKTESREAVAAKPRTERLPKPNANSNVAAWMGVATLFLLGLCLVLSVIGVAICIGLVATS